MNPESTYALQRKSLDEDQKLFRMRLSVVQHKENLGVLEEKYQLYIHKLIGRGNDQLRHQKLVIQLLRIDSKVTLTKRQVFDRLGAPVESLNKPNSRGQSLNRLAIRLAEVEKAKVRKSFKSITQYSKLGCRLENIFNALTRSCDLKSTFWSFYRMKDICYLRRVQNKCPVQGLEQSTQPQSDCHTKVSTIPSSPLVSKLQNQLKEKDSLIRHLRQALTDQTQSAQQKIESLQDQLNRLNFENLKLKEMNQTMTLNGNQDEDLSLRILDQFQSPQNRVEQQLSAKYFSQIVGLKQKIDGVKDFIEEFTASREGMTMDEVKFVLEMLTS